MIASTLAKVATVEGHTVTYNRLINRIYFDKDYGGPSFNAKQWTIALNTALLRAHCTTVARVSMFLAQLGAESGSFRYTEELADGSEYNWRNDLGNNQPGDGPRFKGRSYIQITGRHNYGALSRWAYAHGYVPTSTFFLDNPERLADLDYIFLGAVWYWTVARDMNSYADSHDIVGATRAVNGGLNNLVGRRTRWNRALTFGSALLPKDYSTRRGVIIPMRKPKPRPRPVARVVTVRSGQTLSSIAAANGTSWQRLQKLNNLRNPNTIYVGQKLRVN